MNFFSELFSTLNSINYLDIVGIFGVAFYLINYSLVTFEKIDTRGITFFVINIIGASCVLISLTQSFNLASALIQIFWICLGIVAITIRLLLKPKPKQIHGDAKHVFYSQLASNLNIAK